MLKEECDCQPRPQGLLLDDFRIVGRRPGKGWDHVVHNFQKSWRFLSRDILRKVKTKWRAKHRVGSKTPVKEYFNFVHDAVVVHSKIEYYLTDVSILEQDFSAFVSLFHFRTRYIFNN